MFDAEKKNLFDDAVIQSNFFPSKYDLLMELLFVVLGNYYCVCIEYAFRLGSTTMLLKLLRSQI